MSFLSSFWIDFEILGTSIILKRNVLYNILLPHPPSAWQPITCLAKTVIAWTILNFIIAILLFDTCTRAGRLILCHLMSVPGSLGPSLTCSEVFGADIDKFCTNFVQYNKHINISTHIYTCKSVQQSGNILIKCFVW